MKKPVKARKAKPVKAWAIATSRGRIIVAPYTVSLFRSDAAKQVDPPLKYRVARVEIREI